MEEFVAEIYKLKTNDIKPQKGRVLISEPFADDKIFRHSVVLLTDYNKNGAMGFVLNKHISKEKIPKQLKEELPNFEEFTFSYGGPVALDQMFYIHTFDSEIVEGSYEIMPGLYLGGNYKSIKSKLLNSEIDKTQIRFFIGNSGWSPKQLDNEIKENYWLVKNIEPQDVFCYDKKIWVNQIKQMGNEYDIWTSVPENPTLN